MWLICCRYSFESPCLGDSNEYPQHIFMETYRKLSFNYRQIPSLSVLLYGKLYSWCWPMRKQRNIQMKSRTPISHYSQSTGNNNSHFPFCYYASYLLLSLQSLCGISLSLNQSIILRLVCPLHLQNNVSSPVKWTLENSADPDQMLKNMASDQGLRFLH